MREKKTKHLNGKIVIYINEKYITWLKVSGHPLASPSVTIITVRHCILLFYVASPLRKFNQEQKCCGRCSAIISSESFIQSPSFVLHWSWLHMLFSLFVIYTARFRGAGNVLMAVRTTVPDAARVLPVAIAPVSAGLDCVSIDCDWWSYFNATLVFSPAR